VEGVKKSLPLLLGLWLALSVSVFGKTPYKKKWHTFHRLCGALEYWVPISGGGNTTKPLTGVTLELYPWEAGISCCHDPHPFWTVMTGRGGRYEFKDVNPGRYWLVAQWNDRLYKLPISYAPDKSLDAECGLQGLDIDSKGNFGSWIRATM
jgi:hypothetical protein